VVASVAAALLMPSAAASSSSRVGNSPAALALPPGPGQSPIKHVVVFLQENHSFDNVLGTWCAQTKRCDGVGVGASVSLTDGIHTIQKSDDFIPRLRHEPRDQLAAWNGGANNGWQNVTFCGAKGGYKCLTAFTPDQVPAITQLASTYALSDETSTFALHASWADHFEWFTSGDALGFRGATPTYAWFVVPGPSIWGCTSKMVTQWAPPGSTKYQMVPSCIPDPRTGRPNGGAFRPTPVPSTKSLAESCDDTVGCTWRVYNTDEEWSIVDTFADLHYKDYHVAKTKQFITDARAGTLPSLTFLTPSFSGYATDTSQHNANSMAAGDQAIADAVNAVMTGPDADSTAIFLTYDDCGCFYDHRGPSRVPMVIISPWVKPGYTDSTQTDFSGVARFIEITLGIPPLNNNDATAYPYTNAFDFSESRTLVALPKLKKVAVPASTLQQIRDNPSVVREADEEAS
jgi:phospholipase C